MDFYSIVKIAFFFDDNIRRSEAEQQILQLKDTNIDQFFILCAQGLSNIQIEVPLRQACGTLIKRCATLKTNQGVYNWLLLNPESKKIVKDECLRQLVSSDMNIKRSAANAISEVCAVELPRNEWPEIISTLVTNIKTVHIEIKKAAILTLGYICESLKFNKDQVIRDDDEQKILFGICIGLSDVTQDIEIRKISVKALQDALTFMHHQFEKKECRDYVCNLLINTATSNDKQIRISALQCLIDVIKQLYDIIQDHLLNILQATIQSFEVEDSEISIPAMEIWTSFCVETTDRINSLSTNVGVQQNFLNQISPQKIFLIENHQILINPFLRNLFRNEQHEDEDAGELTIQESAYRALSALTDVVGQPCHQWLTEFISGNINSQEWAQRKAAILAFGALAETNDNDQVRTLIFSALSPLINMLQDQNGRVKIAAARVLAKVAEHYAECYFGHTDQQRHLQIILGALNSKPAISKNIVWLLTFLTEYLPKSNQNVYLVTQKYQILQYLASTAIREDLDQTQYSIIDTCFMGILNVMYSIIDAHTCKQYLSDFHQRIHQTDKSEASRKIHIQSGLLTSMHGCLMRLQPNDLNDQEVSEIFQTFFRFCQDPDLNSDGLYAMSGLASCLKKRFQPFAQTVLGVLNQFLQSVDTQETFKTALFCLADIARGLEDQFIQYIGVLDYLINLINNPLFDRDMKIQVYICIADIVLGAREKCIQYMEKLIRLVQVGFQGCVALTKLGDPNSLDYADRLKEQLMQYYTCLLHAFCDGTNTCTPLLETLPWLFEFAETTCDKKLKPTVEFVRLSLNAILDAGNFFNQVPTEQANVKKYLTSPFVINLINTLQKYSNQPENHDSFIYAKELLSQQFNYQIPNY